MKKLIIIIICALMLTLSCASTQKQNPIESAIERIEQDPGDVILDVLWWLDITDVL